MKFNIKIIMVTLCAYTILVVPADQGYVIPSLNEAEEHFKRSEYTVAEELYEQVLQVLPQNTDEKVLNRTKINYGEVLLALGQYQRGHILFDARLQNSDPALNRKPLQKPWQGNFNLGLKLVRGEHGIGDTFFFLRYVKKMHNLSIPAIVRERSFLKPLLSRQSYIKGVIASDDEEKQCAYEADVYMMSLPCYMSHNGFFALQTADDIPFTHGYIEPRADLVEKWKTYFSKKPNILHVFIGAYRASKNVAGECRYLERDCPISQLIQAISLPGVQLYYGRSGDYCPMSRSEYERRKDNGSLGKHDDEKLDVIEDQEMGTLEILEDFDSKSVGAFEDTAAAMCAADCVVSIDTSAAMLAGALGDKVKCFYVLLPKESDWRWGNGQPITTPFFANTQLLWQPEQGSWETPLVQLQHIITTQTHLKRMQENQ